MNPRESYPVESRDDQPAKKDPRIAVVPYAGILFGIEWDNSGIYPYGLHVSIRIPFVSFDIGLGKHRSPTFW